MDLGGRRTEGKLNADNPVVAGGWTVAFTPDIVQIRVPYEVYHAAVRGPSGSALEVWIDDMFYSAAARGDRNEWDPAQPMVVAPGKTVYFHYNTSAGNPPKVSIFCREVSPL